MSAMGDCRKRGYAGGCRAKRFGDTGHPCRYFGKAGICRFSGTKKEQENGAASPFPRCSFLITVLPEQLQSPLLTAEWEYRLGEIERGQLALEEFLDGISAMLKDLVGTYQVIKGTEYLFAPPREVVGKCPLLRGEVAELQKGFFCQNDSCKFAIWKKTTNGGLPRKNSRPRLWCLHCLTMAVSM